VYFGKDGLSKAGDAVKKCGAKRVLLHYGSRRVLENGIMDKVVDSLKTLDIGYVLLGGVVPNPRLSLVREGADLVKRENIDFILAVGGGSVIDSSKAIAFASQCNHDIWETYMGRAPITAALPTGNIITIAAAGSETSRHTVITNDEGESWLKIGYNHELLRPKFTVMDPELLYSLPPYQTASGIVDIMMHTLDRYFSPGGENEITDHFAEQLLKVVMRYGKICMENPSDYQARSEVLWAGSISHNDMTGLGRVGCFATHRLEHELSAKYDVTHGAGLAAIWGSWARYAYKADVMRFARYGVQVFDLPMNFTNPEYTALEAIRRTEEYFVSIGMPINMTDLVGKKISDEDIDEMSDKCSRGETITIGTFMKLDRPKMLEIYKAAR